MAESINRERLIMEKEIANLLKTKHFEMISELWGGKIDQPIDEVENLVYNVKCNGRNEILRLTHSSHRSEDDVIAELDWVNYLAEHGVKVSVPIHSRNGRLTEIITVNSSYFIACVFERAPGDFIKSDSTEWNTDFFQSWGRTIGRMHALAKTYNPEHLKKKRFEWIMAEILVKAKKFVPLSEMQILQELEQVLQNISSWPKSPDSYGLVHNDLNPSNFFVHNGEITVFDFDDCCYTWFIWDIAETLPFYSQKLANVGWKETIQEVFFHFMVGYIKENQINTFFLKYLPDCLRFLNLSSVVFSFEIDEANRKRYNQWFEQVLAVYKNGHNLYTFDFYMFYKAHFQEFIDV